MGLKERDRHTDSKEIEQNYKVLVTFQGVNHHDLNLQGLQKVKEGIVGHLEASHGENTIILEGGGSSTMVKRLKLAIKKYGFGEDYIISGILKRKNGMRREPTFNEIDRLKNKMNNAQSIDEILRDNLIPRDTVRYYYLFRMLGELNKSYAFNVDFEEWPPQVAQKRKQLTESYTVLQKETFNQWLNGDFSHVVENWKIYCNQDIQQINVRDIEMVDNLKKRTRKLVDSKEGGSIFVLFGTLHQDILDTLSRKFGKNPPIRFNKSVWGESNSIIVQILSTLKKGGKVEDVLYSQEFLSKMFFQKLFDHAHVKGRIFQLTHHFEDLDKEVNTLAREFSLEEIQRLCESKFDLVKFLKQNSRLNEYVT